MTSAEFNEIRFQGGSEIRHALKEFHGNLFCVQFERIPSIGCSQDLGDKSFAMEVKYFFNLGYFQVILTLRKHVWWEPKIFPLNIQIRLPLSLSSKKIIIGR